MRSGTSRDGRQQSRLIRGNKDGFEICTVDHQKDGKIRLDATISYRGDTNELGVYAHDDEAYDHDSYFKVYAPCAGDALHPPDEGFRRYNSDGNINRECKVERDRAVVIDVNAKLTQFHPLIQQPLILKWTLLRGGTCLAAAPLVC
jgi:hypothetical protein